MGKIFPLSEKSSLFEGTLKLIEKSFHYKDPFSFKIDFAPLMDVTNHKNCFIMIDENENVIAHVGTKEHFITLNEVKYPITLIGGIAVDESRRGEGHFQTLFQDVLAEKRSDTTFFLLWSDQEKLYNKFGFHLCGTQIEVEREKKISPFLKTTFANLNENEKKSIKDLYTNSFAKTYLTIERNGLDWKLIEQMTSADLFIRKENDIIQDYYFMNKGQDLPGIIYEYGTRSDLTLLIEEISSYGKVWLGRDLISGENLQFQFFMAPGDLRTFTNFIFNLTGEKFKIRNINPMKQEVFFDFNNETLSLELPEFLKGVFGPGIFEEIEVKPFFLSGLDSI
jgi:predicted GNAT family N-acyltransferase